MYLVYILKSQKTERYYVGYTSNIGQRLVYHNSGKNKSTKSGIPWCVVYKEKCPDKKYAWLREHQIKNYKGGQAFKRLINN